MSVKKKQKILEHKDGCRQIGPDICHVIAEYVAETAEECSVLAVTGMQKKFVEFIGPFDDDKLAKWIAYKLELFERENTIPVKPSIHPYLYVANANITSMCTSSVCPAHSFYWRLTEYSWTEAVNFARLYNYGKILDIFASLP